MKRKTALYGLLVALAFVLSLLESLVPLPIGIPGVKLGLANGVVLVTMYLLSTPSALVVSCLRILLAGLTFGSPASMLYSFAGGLVSFGVMVLCRRSGRFSIAGVSMAGGVSHNLAPLVVAALVLQTPRIVWYLPVLLCAGLVTGWLLGFLATLLLPRLEKMKQK